MKFSSLKKITTGQYLRFTEDREIGALATDSRKVPIANDTLFFALRGLRYDGHQFISELYCRGIRQFVVDRPIATDDFPTANILLVDSTLNAFQLLAARHRAQFSIPVVGVTGSNGKTIIKEWLFQLLAPDYEIVKNPGSYNSQIGVPLAVWQMQQSHTLGIFEAGISQPGEMENLKTILKPTIGIFTNIGTAHDEGFEDRGQKIDEKLRLFTDTDIIVYNADHVDVHVAIQKRWGTRAWSWGKAMDARVRIDQPRPSTVVFHFSGNEFSIVFPFQDAASVENVCHCVVLMIYLGYKPPAIQTRIHQLKSVPMRLELKQGLNHCQVIDDTYNNDLAGLQISLDFLEGLQHKRKVVILSDILQSGVEPTELARLISASVMNAEIKKFIGIGPSLSANRGAFETLPSEFFESTEEFLSHVDWHQFQGDAILVKGARIFQFEKIIRRMQKKAHGTVMEIDLGAMVENLNYFKSLLRPGAKLMVMVKAFAYGSGSEEVASLLQYHKVDYLGVAYADEGVELRTNQIVLPVMVMNPTEESFGTLIEHTLEPEIYSLPLLRSLATYLDGRQMNVHLKLDTGMHRLGMDKSDLAEAISLLKEHTNLNVVSVFSHLSGADEKAHDDFTRAQATLFVDMANDISQLLGISPMRHLLNSSGILRFPEYQFEMVRLGIGLYGVDPTEQGDAKLTPAAALKTIISQIKTIKRGETVGYGRKGMAERETIVATIAIGYADGFSRMFSRGAGAVLIRGRLAPVIGNVCMDMTMVDITGIQAQEGDEVIVFGKSLPIQEVAARIGTIPYEILTSTSERVKRVFFAESL